MSSTRHSKDPSVFNQERYASSPAYDCGLLANLFARRCSIIDGAADRELLWFLQFKSHQKGGLEQFASEILAKWPERAATKSMQKFGTSVGTVYTPEQMRAVSGELPRSMADAWEGKNDGDLPTAQSSCLEASTGLSAWLTEFCTNPRDQLGHTYREIGNRYPWYFPALSETIREYQHLSAEGIRAKLVLTEVGKQVFETLDYSLQERCLTLITGLERIGKTHAAKAWCAMRPGQARFVEVPSSNDDIGFFRAIAAPLGVAINQNSKAQELRSRIEQALAPGDLMLVFDEGHYLFPSSCYRHALPSRINWIMTALVNKDIPVSIVTTPQFFDSQKALKKRVPWRDGQFIGRVGHYQVLPETLTIEDLSAVAQSLLPGGGPRCIQTLVHYAKSSARYLAGMTTLVKRADFLARKAGRVKILRDDINQAIRDSVMPSDETLANALADRPKSTKAKPARSNILPILPQEPDDVIPAPARNITPARSVTPLRARQPVEAVDLPDGRHMQPA